VLSERTGIVIEARELTQRYGAKTAVDDLTFAVQPGIVTGASGHEKIRVCGQLAPGSRPSFLQSCGHRGSRLLAMCSLPVSGVS
ncbi:MAG: hypothetical protein ABSA03_17395, partial [Streptosporangiaceae bacterium]